MADIDHKTTELGTESGSLLEVEWNIYTPHRRIPDNTFQQIEERKVTLCYTSQNFAGKPPCKVRLIDFSPHTALNLLAWLEQERTELERLATVDEEVQECL